MKIESTKTDPIIDPRVPDELWLAVIVGQVSEAEAVERGRRANEARSEEERRNILFGSDDAPVIPPPGYRPVGNPPWKEP